MQPPCQGSWGEKTRSGWLRLKCVLQILQSGARRKWQNLRSEWVPLEWERGYDGFKQANLRFRFGLIAVLIVGLTATALADKRADAKAQVAFGVAVAQKGLWKEATQRWENATALDPTYASAWNNLAIGYEQLGRFEDAKKAYERAIDLDPKDQYIRDNYQLFREIYDRQNRARGK